MFRKMLCGLSVASTMTVAAGAMGQLADLRHQWYGPVLNPADLRHVVYDPVHGLLRPDQTGPTFPEPDPQPSSAALLTSDELRCIAGPFRPVAPRTEDNRLSGTDQMQQTSSEQLAIYILGTPIPSDSLPNFPFPPPANPLVSLRSGSLVQADPESPDNILPHLPLGSEGGPIWAPPPDPA